MNKSRMRKIFFWGDGWKIQYISETVENGEPDYCECNSMYGKDPCANGIRYWSITPRIRSTCTVPLHTTDTCLRTSGERIYPKGL